MGSERGIAEKLGDNDGEKYPKHLFDIIQTSAVLFKDDAENLQQIHQSFERIFKQISLQCLEQSRNIKSNSLAIKFSEFLQSAIHYMLLNPETVSQDIAMTNCLVWLTIVYSNDLTVDNGPDDLKYYFDRNSHKRNILKVI